MFIYTVNCIFKLCLLIVMIYSFEIPKHDWFDYYKSYESVSLPYPDNHTTIYDFYVAGKTLRIDIPTDVGNLYSILRWKVIGIDGDRLIYVHDDQPLILNESKKIEEIMYPGYLNGAIIAFGNNEFLHVPMIYSDFDHPNYIELLQFNSTSREITLNAFVPRFYHQDEKWQMRDYIHIDNKLYLLIDHSYGSSHNVSIIRMCLEKGSQLISSAVEIHFSIGFSYELRDAVFVFDFRNTTSESQRYQVHTILETATGALHHYNNTIKSFISLFQMTTILCAHAEDNVFLMGSELNNFAEKCQPFTHVNCSTGGNIMPTLLVSAFVDMMRSDEYIPPGFGHKLRSITMPYPAIFTDLFIEYEVIINSQIVYTKCHFTLHPSDCTTVRQEQVKYHLNKNPYGTYLLINGNANDFVPFPLCSSFTNCIDCIIFGLNSLNCIWQNNACNASDSIIMPKSDYTLDYCFKIANVYQKDLYITSSVTLIIQLEEPVNFSDHPPKYLSINVGPNTCNCTYNNNSYMICHLNFVEEGTYPVKLLLYEIKFADSSNLTAISKVNISFASNEIEIDNVNPLKMVIIITLLLSLIFSSFILGAIIFFTLNKKKLSEFKEILPKARLKRKLSWSTIKAASGQLVASELSIRSKEDKEDKQANQRKQSRKS